MASQAGFIAIDLIAIACLLIGIFTCFLILLTILRNRNQQNNIGHLLIGNTCVCTLELCISYLVIYGFILNNDIAGDTLVNNATSMTFDQQYLCPLRSYFLFSGFSLLYTSYCLQAYYRLRQVIFYKHRLKMQTFLFIIVVQWIFSFLLVLPMYLLNAFEYLPSESFCPIPFTRPLAVAYIAVTVYGVFLAIFIAIYLWIYAYANRTTLVTLQRRQVIDRQVAMLKRIILPTCSLMSLGVVYLIMFFQTLINQYQTHALTYRLSYLFIAIGMSFIHLITIYLTPGMKSEVTAFLRCHLNALRRLSAEETKHSLVAVVPAPTSPPHLPMPPSPPVALPDPIEIQMRKTSLEPKRESIVPVPISC